MVFWDLWRRPAGCGADRLDLGAQPRWLRGCGGVQPYEMEKICKSSVTPGLNLLGTALRYKKNLFFVGIPRLNLPGSALRFEINLFFVGIPRLNLPGLALRNEKSLLFVGRPQLIKAQTKDLYQPMYQFHGKAK